METQHLSVKLVLDDAPLRGALKELPAPELALELIEAFSQVIDLEADVLPAAGTCTVRVSLQPGERFLEHVTALLRARQVNGVVVEEVRHELTPPACEVTPVQSEPR